MHTVKDFFNSKFGKFSDSEVSGGNYSRVFKTAYGTILKLTTDATYIEYLHRCERLKDNPHTPKPINIFGEVAVLKGEARTCRLFAVELPTYYDDYDFGAVFGQKGSFSLMKRLEGIADVFHHYADFPIVDGYGEDSYEENITSLYNIVEDLLPLGINPIHVLELSSVIRNMTEELHCFTDLHLGNFMLDGSKNVIVTDPVGESTDQEDITSGYSWSTFDRIEIVDFHVKEHIMETIVSMLNENKAEYGYV